MKIDEIFDKAATLISEKGWIKGRFESCEGYCISGALRKITQVEKYNYWSDDYQDYKASFEALSVFLDENVVIWNDEACSSQQQAVSVLKDAARTYGERLF